MIRCYHCARAGVANPYHTSVEAVRLCSKGIRITIAMPVYGPADIDLSDGLAHQLDGPLTVADILEDHYFRLEVIRDNLICDIDAVEMGDFERAELQAKLEAVRFEMAQLLEQIG